MTGFTACWLLYIAVISWLGETLFLVNCNATITIGY